MMRPNETKALRAEDIVSIEPSGISMMPRGLVSTMEDSDILDLLAYLLSSGDSEDPMFKN